jgi:competence protein ComEA
MASNLFAYTWIPEAARRMARLRPCFRPSGRWAWLPVLVACAATGAWAQLPEGPGKQETEKRCVQCHDLAKALSVRQDADGWGTTLNKMVALGLKASDDELLLIRDYLAKNFPPAELPPLNVNTARAIQLESRLTLKRSEAAAIIRYRKEHGDFKSVEDLKNVPGVDFAKIEAKKDRLAF